MKSKYAAKVPNSFQLGGSTIEVQVVENTMESTEHAWCDMPSGKIKISDSHCGAPCSSDFIESSFYHELAHAILRTMGKTELNKDEEFVEGFGNLLHQFIKTSRYE